MSDTFIFMMRVYFEKPRTTVGWKGMLYDPLLDGTHDIQQGLKQTRKLLLDLALLGVPCAAEFLDPLAAPYLSDLLSWGCIGARTAESQTHRQMASFLPMPIAFKNSTSGSISVAVQGIQAAAQSHQFLGIDCDGRISQIHSRGNSHCHLVLRGSEEGPNYDPLSISNALKILQQGQLPAHLLVDCSHDNSRRNPGQQIQVFQSVIHQLAEGEKGIRGLILESHLHGGNQSIHQPNLQYGISLTDPCLDWNSTAQLIQWGRHYLSTAHSYAFDTP